MAPQRAVSIERVSSRKQTPQIQSPEITARVRERRYELARTFTLVASASKGKQQGVLDQVLDGARNGEWTVVLCVAIDRIERRGVFALREWITALYKAGARLESTSPGEEWLSDTSDELIWSIRLDMEADRARREAELRKERTRRGHDEKDRLSQGRVPLPLGWRYEYPDGKKAKFRGEIVADDEAMAVVREAFALAAGGATLRQIAKMMGERGYPRTTNGVAQMMRHPAYPTGHLYVPVLVEADPVVDPGLAAAAVAALEARRKPQGPRHLTTRATDFGGRIYCAEHGAALHRWYGPARKDGTRTRYYWARKGGAACSCGLFGADTVDDLVNTLLLTDTEPETEMVFQGDSSARLAQIEREMNQVYREKPSGWLATLAELEAEQTRLRDTGAPGWERTETGRSMGDAWRSKTRAEQREYLARQAETGNWRVLVVKDGKQLRVVWRPLGFEDSAVDANTERYAGWTSLRSGERHVSKAEV